MSTQNSPVSAVAAGVARFVALVLLLAGLALPAVAADDAPVTSNLEAFLVVKNADGTERFTPANRVTPGGVIEYRITYTNNTDNALADFTVNGAVPKKTAYLANSQSSDVPAAFEAEITDLGWVSVPAFRDEQQPDGTIRKVEVPASEYLNVRWRLEDGLAGASNVNVTYRVRIDN